MIVNQRLKIFAEETGLTAYRIAKDSGLSPVVVSEYLKDKKAVGSENLLAIVTAYPSLNLNWLFKGTGEMIDRSTLQVERIAA